jgi:hypothetical protein
MAKRIVLYRPDDTEMVLQRCPSLPEMRRLVDGNLEFTRVLDRKVHGIGRHPHYVMTMMVCNDTGTIDGLPRNKKATEIYQRLTREQFGHLPGNPFVNSKRAFREEQEARGFKYIDATPLELLAQGYDEDPWIAGPVIIFEGYTFEEADELIAGDSP